ncbi:hypothetical protein RvY_10840 [Ramazzottius varieornatus]|uniref:Uncharacterized protein n=1 Tax=Ramazzottius varieornatus TaxID=947166 RepID=A0A1D1VGJ6_RAMVA|nr:hypothetical protein RvY_10840 [Ramazzottius varieornatus]
MVHFAAGIAVESSIHLLGVVRKVDSLIDTCSQQDVQLVIQKVFLVSPPEPHIPTLAAKAYRLQERSVTAKCNYPPCQTRCSRRLSSSSSITVWWPLADDVSEDWKGRFGVRRSGRSRRLHL